MSTRISIPIEMLEKGYELLEKMGEKEMPTLIKKLDEDIKPEDRVCARVVRNLQLSMLGVAIGTTAEHYATKVKPSKKSIEMLVDIAHLQLELRDYLQNQLRDIEQFPDF